MLHDIQSTIFHINVPRLVFNVTFNRQKNVFTRFFTKIVQQYEETGVCLTWDAKWHLRGSLYQTTDKQLQ